MKSRWYIVALITLLTFISVNRQQSTVPNQEIVVQFNADAVTFEDTQNTITIVKAQLKSVGANIIKVQEDEAGKLRITYYSDIDIADIKKALSNENKLEIGFSPVNKDDSKNPSEENSNRYNFDVYEIKQGNDTEWDLNGITVIELKSESNRFLNPNFYAFFDTVEWHEHIEKVAYKTHCKTAIAIDNTSRKIPEVRAGPLA